MFFVSRERSKNKCVKTLSQLRCFRMAIAVLDYEPITFTERKCANDQESVANERPDLQLPLDSCRFNVALFSPLVTGTCGPRLASGHGAVMLKVFTRFSIFLSAWVPGQKTILVTVAHEWPPSPLLRRLHCRQWTCHFRARLNLSRRDHHEKWFSGRARE